MSHHGLWPLYLPILSLPAAASCSQLQPAAPSPSPPLALRPVCRVAAPELNERPKWWRRSSFKWVLMKIFRTFQGVFFNYLYNQVTPQKVDRFMILIRDLHGFTILTIPQLASTLPDRRWKTTFLSTLATIRIYVIWANDRQHTWGSDRQKFFFNEERGGDVWNEDGDVNNVGNNGGFSDHHRVIFSLLQLQIESRKPGVVCSFWSTQKISTDDNFLAWPRNQPREFCHYMDCIFCGSQI